MPNHEQWHKQVVGRTVPSARRERALRIRDLMFDGYMIAEVADLIGASHQTVSADISVLRIIDPEAYNQIRQMITRRSSYTGGSKQPQRRFRK